MAKACMPHAVRPAMATLMVRIRWLRDLRHRRRTLRSDDDRHVAGKPSCSGGSAGGVAFPSMDAMETAMPRWELEMSDDPIGKRANKDGATAKNLG